MLCNFAFWELLGVRMVVARGRGRGRLRFERRTQKGLRW